MFEAESFEGMVPRVPTDGSIYSDRNATTGSTRDARAAGMRYPASAIAARPTAEPANTIGSVALTSYNKLRSTLDEAAAITAPAAIPAPLSSRPSRSTIDSNDDRLAPTAARIASSRSRCATVYDITL